MEGDPALDDLRAACDGGNLVVLAGAGVSMAAGLPGRKRLVELVAERARLRGGDPATLAEITELAAQAKYIDALSAAKLSLGEVEFNRTIERHLADEVADEPELARAIAALAPRLRAVLTTSIDRVLERAFGGRWPVLAQATGDIATRRGFVLKLHGTLPEWSTWVLTREQYERAMYADPRLKAAFGALFNTCPILFVGYGLADDDFAAILGQVRALSGGQPPQHFALAPAQELTPYRRRTLQDAGIRLIAYANPDGGHGELVRILRDLGAAPQAKATSAAAGLARTPDEVLQQLAAQRILNPMRLRDGHGQPPEPGPDARLIARYLELTGCRCGLAKVNQLYRGTAGGARIVDVVLGVAGDGSFVVAFGPEAGARQDSCLGDIARALGPLGGALHLFDPVDGSMAAHPGAEVVELRAAVDTLVRDPLRAHAQQCIAEWTDDRERRFVAGRARLASGEELSVAEAIEHVLAANRRALLLGDFGTGKSTQMARRAATLARAYLEHGHRRPAPVLLPLRGMRPDLATLAGRHLPELPVEALRLAVDLGMAIPLLDGVDEMQIAPHEAEGLVAALTGAFRGERARMVLSTRSTLFRSVEQRDAALRAVPSLEVVSLQELDRAEVVEYVGKAAPSRTEAEATLGRIAKVHDLESLARRPALLELIVQHRDKLSSEGMSATRLYEMAAEEWLGSRREQEREVKHPERLAFARSLARELFASGREAATYKEVARVMLDVLSGEAPALDPAGDEIRKTVFLAFDADGRRLRFAHRSFLEYFLAVDIAERLDAGREDALDLPRLTPEVVAFLSGLEGWARSKEAMRAVLASGYRRRVSENALLAIYHAARGEVGEGEALGEALDKDLPGGCELAGAELAGVELPWISLAGADLTGANLSQARLRCADLRGARLDRAKADHTVLDGAALDGASARDADLFGASLVDASTAGVRWDGADCEGVIVLDDAHVPGGLAGNDRGSDTLLTAVYQCHGGGAAIAWSPDRRWLARTSYRMIHLLDAVTGSVRLILHGHQHMVNAVAFSPDGTTLASGSDDNSVRLWDARTGELRKTLSGHQNAVYSVAFSPDGTALASGSDDNSVRLWDARTGELRKTLSGHQNAVLSVAFSPDGTALASGSNDHSVRLWDARTGELRKTLSGHQDPVYSVAFSPDGTTLASGSNDHSVRLWDARTGELRKTLSGHPNTVYSVAFSPDGTALASGSGDQSVRLWDARTGELRKTLSGHQDAVLSVAFSPDGTALASGSGDQSICLWDARTGELRKALSGHRNAVFSVVFSPDGTALASGSYDHSIRLWDARTGELRKTLSGHQASVRPVVFSPDGTTLASGSDDHSVRLWDARTGELRKTLSGHQESVYFVAFSPDGTTLASGSDDHSVRLWDARTGELRKTLSGHRNAVDSVAFSPDGTTLASGSDDHSVRLWDARTGELRKTLSGHQDPVYSVAFSPDGTTLASGSDDHSVRLWDARTGELRKTLSGHQGSVWPVAFSPDGTTLASGSYDDSVCLWDARTGELRKTLSGHQGSVWPVAFSPDGTTLAFGSSGYSVRLWDARTGELRKTLSGYRRSVGSVVFSPDGTTLASGSDDHSVRLWDARTGMCIAALYAVGDAALAYVEGTPFFTGSGDISPLVRLVADLRVMPPDLWAPLFERPDLVQRALAGEPPDLAALGLATYADCAAALAAERARRGLVRRRRPRATIAREPHAPEALEHTITLTRLQVTLAVQVGGKRPSAMLPVRIDGLPPGASISAELHLGSGHRHPAQVAHLHRDDRADATFAEIRADVPMPGTAVLSITVTSPDGSSRTDPFSVTFVPDNPYIAGPPIHHPAQFYGRDAEIAWIVRDLDRSSIALLGAMRIGKSSLLHQLAHRFSGTAVYLSLQQYAGRLDRLLPDLAHLIAPGEPTEGDPYACVDRTILRRLEQLRARGPEPRYVLLLDDAQVLAGAPELRRQLGALFQSRHHDGLRGVIAGSPAALRELAADVSHASPPALLATFQPVRLGPMTAAEIARLVTTPLGDEITLTDEAVARVVALSGGQPLIAQLLCHDALDALRAEGRYRMEADDIEQALRDKVLDSVADLFTYQARWAALPDEVRELLRKLAAMPPEERGTLDAHSARLLSDHHLADKAKRRLELEPTFFVWLQEVEP
ncbi:SIR2 family protein [Sorangium sp. So ce131]|uniref:WD40 domain-containing protein n=1 Tax=Sorangium sp. So ce131 TaxID=3133282 RepID=UPI003F6038FA